MQRGSLFTAGLLLGVCGLLWLVNSAEALITRETPLADLLEASTLVATATVDSLDKERPAMMLVLDEALKGKVSQKKWPVLLKGDSRAVKEKESPQLLKRLAEKLTLVLFIRETDNFGIACSNGTWLSMSGAKVDGQVRWSFSHLEPYLRRTYAGTTAEMVQTVRDALSGKRKAPAVNKKEKPGLGPEVAPPKKTGALTAPCEPQRAVIPTVLVGGPLAMLAMLFPAVFGGWKRWLVLLSTVGTTTTLMSLHWLFGDDLSRSWWGTPIALWALTTAVTVLGMSWAWQRHLIRVQSGEAPIIPGKLELIVLLVVALLGLAGLGTVKFVFKQRLLDPSFWNAWWPVVAFGSAVWGGALYVLWARVRPRPFVEPSQSSAWPPASIERQHSQSEQNSAVKPSAAGTRLAANPELAILPSDGSPQLRTPAVATEAVILTALVLVNTFIAPSLLQQTIAGGLEGGESTREVSVRLVWSFNLPAKGAIASSPLVVGDRVYVAAAHDDVFRPYGAVYCLDRATGKTVWTFDDKRKMKQVFSSPVVVGNRLWIGEGFHQDDGCRIFCLSADKGEKLWEFDTGSHTESSPFVIDGKVYCGAGDDGMYCLAAERGEKLWNFPSFHIDASPAVADGRVYAGCGIGDTFKTTALFGLDAKTGKPIWRCNTQLPVWSRPVVAGGFVYAGTGNGRLNESEDAPAGAVLCVSAIDGGEVWKRKFPDGVLGRLAADRRHVFFGCRDGYFYCLRRIDGAQVWRRQMGKHVVAGPALEAHPSAESAAERVYAAGMEGFLACMEPATGKLIWSRSLFDPTKSPVELIATPALEVGTEKDGSDVRRLYVGLTRLSTARLGELHCFEETAAARE